MFPICVYYNKEGHKPIDRKIVGKVSDSKLKISKKDFVSIVTGQNPSPQNVVATRTCENCMRHTISSHAIKI